MFAVSRLFAILSAHVEANHLGLVAVELDTELGERDVRRPDLIFVTSEQLREVDPDEAATAEDAELVVEVLSPQSRQTDRVDKFEQYAASGIPNYWVIDPEEKTFEAYVLRGKSYRIHARGKNSQIVKSRPFSDLKIPLARLWWSA
jgi:Uma2 family endonuclease